MDSHALDTLQFERIRELLTARAASIPGSELADGLRPLNDLARVRRLHEAVAEAHTLQIEDPGWNTVGFPDARDGLAQAQVEGALLEPRQLQDVSGVLKTAARILGFFHGDAAQTRYPHLAGLANHLFADDEFPERIERTFEPSGEVLDGASAQLRTIRRRLRRTQQALSARLEQMSREIRGSGEDSIVTLRAGRYVLSVAAAEKRRVKGIVHDRSASGKTLYLEPLQIVEQNNEIAELEADERLEIRRLLAELSAWVRAHAKQIAETIALLARLDEINARATLARDLRASAPVLDESAALLRIVKGRHPLLFLAVGDRVVPLDLTLEGKRRGLIISGPNMGGKTVVLKTTGLIVLMALAGLFVPSAEGSVVPWIDGLFIDIGDEQSLESDLSTYAARLRNMKAMLDSATQRSLVLIDELGAGTDPEEGAALGEALLEQIGARGSFCVVSTHHGAFKAFAAQAPGFENAAVEYDTETLRPTYRLRPGVPGRSHAFELARREQWPPEVLTDATGRLSREGIRTEELLTQVETLRHDLEKAREAVREEQRSVEEERARFRRLSRAFKDKMESVRLEKAVEEDRRLRELHDLHQEMRGRIEALGQTASVEEVSELRSWFHSRERRAAELKKSRRSVRRSRRDEQGRVLAPDELVPGRRVYSRSLGLDVEVLENDAHRGQVWVEHRGRRIAVPPQDLEARKAASTGEEPGSPSALAAYVEAQDAAMEQVSGEIDLRGLRADECLTQLELYLDRALLAGYPQVRIIHGKGAGILRREVQRFLDAHRHVRSFRDGEGPEGGWGVTIAVLAGGGQQASSSHAT